MAVSILARTVFSASGPAWPCRPDSGAELTLLQGRSYGYSLMRYAPLFLIRSLLVVQLSMLAGGPQGATVLCIDPGRHVALETGAGRCTDNVQVSPTTGQPDQTVDCAADACVRCIDVPIGAEGARHTPPPSPLRSFSAPCAISASNTLLLPQLSADCPLAALEPSVALAQGIRSTILRV